ncbi:hypothetical protein SAMN06269250_3309 [Spirosoma fluviale]|uniref:Uncharacterized protein n=1 Tax=Spirosoma fluviale TaxID=1597977 RepID=A0A286G3S0_9BACT|nr:hypothetical protein SAMN06269250_3309 [Spirosoma fluviale]
MTLAHFSVVIVARQPQEQQLFYTLKELNQRHKEFIFRILINLLLKQMKKLKLITYIRPRTQCSSLLTV